MKEKFSFPPPRPSLLELANNFKDSTKEWAKAGFPVAAESEYDRRHSICGGCEYWMPNDLGGVGRCRICGCAGFKLWLETSTCPLGKWEDETGQIGANDDDPKNV